VYVTLLPYEGGFRSELARTPAYTLAGRSPEGLTAEVEVAHEVGKTQVRRQPSPDLLVEQPLELTEYLPSLVLELAHLIGRQVAPLQRPLERDVRLRLQYISEGTLDARYRSRRHGLKGTTAPEVEERVALESHKWVRLYHYRLLLDKASLAVVFKDVRYLCRAFVGFWGC
jgi:hypothetical protein